MSVLRFSSSGASLFVSSLPALQASFRSKLLISNEVEWTLNHTYRNSQGSFTKPRVYFYLKQTVIFDRATVRFTAFIFWNCDFVMCSGVIEVSDYEPRLPKVEDCTWPIRAFITPGSQYKGSQTKGFQLNGLPIN